MADAPIVFADLGSRAGTQAQHVALSSLRLLAIALACLAASWLARTLAGRIADPRAAKQMQFFAPKLAALIALFVGFEMAGIDISGMAALLATLGMTGAVVFTPIGQNLVAGAMTRTDDLYQVGEIVTVGDMFGKVVYQSVLRTELELPDGTKAWVPNAKFQDDDVLNHSRMGGFRVSVDIPLDGTPDRALAVGIMEAVLADLPWNAPGKPAYVVFNYVGGEAMFFKAFAWIEDRTSEPYYRGLLLTALVDALEGAGLSVGQTTNLSFLENSS